MWSFHFDCVKGMVEQFRPDLLKPLDKFDDLRFAKEKENKMRRLWANFSHTNQKTLRVDRIVRYHTSFPSRTKNLNAISHSYRRRRHTLFRNQFLYILQFPLPVS